MTDTDATGTALVTGGARGLGREYALRLAERGLNVAVADIDLQAYEEYEREQAQVDEEGVVAELRDHGVDAIGIEADVTDPDAVQAMADAVADEFGRIDIVVANAGGGVGPNDDTLASELDLEHLHATIERNLYGTIYTCLAVAPYMKEQEYGRIVTVASGAGRQARRDGSYAHYGAAKAGIIMYTKYLAQDVGEYGITANVIAPGYIGTGRLMEAFEKRGIEDVESDTALERIGTPEDCADVVEFLTSDAADYVTGAVLPIDGGQVRGL
ncbi:SDR family oxidoreductase [Salinadaptatus halalkaliphilus]|uniref:SDR family oxidoreductase n=1 Tax=Salinadaptatus halalkaliphilus TaxID=2419781 RepID=A0A4S3TRZ1_9EURY|nr:SDR family NAD(P)-dependent oxidoreductase [Salinadaptatus halalkaliphilus]THE66123.1 SDR family oxidoreductase [Salinadaptatus halalkaliphilus]